MVSAKVLSSALPRCMAIFAVSISVMSLMAASRMKSSVFGATPSTELTPVFSPTDCAMAGVASRLIQANASSERFIMVSLGGFGIDGGDGEFGQRVVRLLLFIEGLVEQLDDVLVTERRRPGL